MTTGSQHPPAAEQESAAGWLSYDPPAGGPDEAFTPSGESHPHWNDLLGSLGTLGPGELTRRWDEARELIRENGVTYNVYGDPRGLDRPWQLDPVPLVITPAEWDSLEAGLTQRARLLEALLRDLYGPQRCLAEGLVPPELVYANPAFLRPCHGLRPSGGRHLHLYAANVGRSADGFCVLGDRAQSPSGAGYALENRIVMSRMLPEAFRDCRVQRLALFFRTLRDGLRAAAPHNRDDPRVVLLTPGPYNETYFEHAYLARYLGWPLAEGGDLTVRDSRVYLKVLGGLQPVDVILRRLDDDFCDPLELRPDSFLGVPGLVQAAHAGNVAVANALGSGVLETTALLAFLPGLCRPLLGEDLKLPSVPTWWCGDPAAREHVLANLRDLVIKPALPGTRLEPVFGDELTREQRDELAAKVRARPRDYVGQARMRLSTAPVFADGRFRPRHLVLRTYLTADRDGYRMMPGGLTRVSAAADTMVVSMQRGGGSKDTWVLSDGPVSNFSLLRPAELPVALTRGGRDLPSRVADNLFWLGRYAERADGLARLLRGALVRMAEAVGEAAELPALLQAVAAVSDRKPGAGGADAELLAAIHDARDPGSLVAVLGSLTRAAGTVRDRISNDMWRVLGDLGDPRDDGPARSGRSAGDELELLDRAVLGLAAFAGLAGESMTRGEGWRFLDMGRKLERSLHTVGLLRATLARDSGHEGPILEAVLEIADSVMTYRRRYQGGVQTAAVLDLLLADETNPRSLAYQMAALAEHVAHLPRDAGRPGRSTEERLMLSALTALRMAEPDQLARSQPGADRPGLIGLLDRLGASLPAVSDAITQTYLSHLQTSRHLAALGGG